MHSASGYLVLAMIAPGKKVTLDSFMDRLYEHFGIVVAPAQYRRAIEDGSWKSSKDMADCFEINGRCFQDFLKQCGFLRDLSDATVEEEHIGNLKCIICGN